jgi:hypothetical protein
LVVLGLLVGLGLLIGLAFPAPAPPAGRPGPAAAAAPPGAESSAWYCTGAQGTASGLGRATILLTNRSGRTVQGNVVVSAIQGAVGRVPVSVPPYGQAEVDPATVQPGDWLGTRIALEGGGVVATQLVQGPSGWAQAPCASRTSTSWYFAAGSTGAGHGLFLSVFNPTTAAAVVDLAFTTPGGISAPPPFQGVAVPAGAVVVANVATFVQGDPNAAALVTTVTGRVVAGELETYGGPQGLSGLSLRLGAPAPAPRWSLPATEEVGGGSVTLDLLNPSPSPVPARLVLRYVSGARLVVPQDVAADSLVAVPLDAGGRLGTNQPVDVTVVGPGGLVVDRTVAAPPAAGSPQWGAAPAIPTGSCAAGTTIVPGPGQPGSPAVPGAAPYALGLADPGPAPVTVTVRRLVPGGPASLGVPVLHVPAGGFVVLNAAALAPVGLSPLVVTASGPVCTSEDAVPAGMPGVVSLAGLGQG